MRRLNSLLLAGCIVSSAVSASTLDKALNKSSEINQSAIQTQKKIDGIANTMQERIQQFKALQKEIDGLSVYNAQLQTQVDNQFKEMADINLSMDQVSVVERQITPLMLRMITSLSQFVELDIPFLALERQTRLEKLTSLMTRADVSSSEKFRRILEAYQIEVDYGRTIESYTELLEIDGQEREVEFLRIGRLELLYVTKDGRFAGSFDKQSRTFKSLPESHISQINKGIRIAKKQLAPDLLMLPIQAQK